MGPSAPPMDPTWAPWAPFCPPLGALWAPPMDPLWFPWAPSGPLLGPLWPPLWIAPLWHWALGVGKTTQGVLQKSGCGIQPQFSVRAPGALTETRMWDAPSTFCKSPRGFYRKHDQEQPREPPGPLGGWGGVTVESSY